MKAMTQKKRVGLLNVRSSRFRDACLPHPKTVLSAVQTALPVVATKKNEDLLTIIRVGKN